MAANSEAEVRASAPTWDNSLELAPYQRRAIELARHALQLDPANPEAHLALVSAYFDLNEWESYQASESFRERVRETGMLAYRQKHGWPDLCEPVGEDGFMCD